jgi:predicted ABC-type ATPase
VTDLAKAVESVLAVQKKAKKPLAVVLAGHNGSGKSTMWRQLLSPRLQIPLINADRMMLSILPEPDRDGSLVDWARHIRDQDQGWMQVAQNGVQAFVGQAMSAKVPFAMETVFSHWVDRGDGSFASKIDNIRDMQAAGYFVLLFFVGLESPELSMLRVEARVADNGHDVPASKLRGRYPRTQLAVRAALSVADAAILTDNSRMPAQAFTVCRIQIRETELFDLRAQSQNVPKAILRWLQIVAPK